RTCPTQPSGHRNPLLNPNLHWQRAPHAPLERPSCLHHEVVVTQPLPVHSFENRRLRRPSLNLIAEINRLHDRADLVIPILPRTEHLQSPVDLGRCDRPHPDPSFPAPCSFFLRYAQYTSHPSLTISF